MSEHLRAAREKLRGAIADIDARLVELEGFKAEEAQLREHRAQLVALLDGPASPSPDTSTRPASTSPSGASASARDVSGRSRAPQATGVFRVDVANRILTLLQRRGSATSSELLTASKVSRPTMNRIVADLIASKQVVRTGTRVATRYHLPGNAGAPPADSEGDRGARRVASRR